VKLPIAVVVYVGDLMVGARELTQLFIGLSHRSLDRSLTGGESTARRSPSVTVLYPRGALLHQVTMSALLILVMEHQACGTLGTPVNVVLIALDEAVVGVAIHRLLVTG
jgi:hypothetical protein